jgi:Xaa-Pro aminopeptidase
VKKALAELGVNNCTVELIREFKDSLSANIETLKVTNNISRRMSVAIDKNSCTQKYYELLYLAFGSTPESMKVMDFTPVSHLRVLKSAQEVEGMEEALRIESAALITFYA